MDEIKQQVLKIPNPNDEVNEQVYFNINEYEVIDALIITGKEQSKKQSVYPVLD
jgi:hypothetical protein